MTVAYYNEIDRYCCDWLSNLMDGGHITPGKIDDRDIREVQPEDLHGFERVHFFAGIAGWEYALHLAGWSGPVWTGSCPCQPFSIAGQGKGEDDDRHLWPAFRDLVAECRPATVYGEQVASPLGRSWLASVHADLEDVGYAVAGADLCAAGIGAPHIRQRLWWVAYAPSARPEGTQDAGAGCEDARQGAWRLEPERSGDARRLADADGRDARAERLQRGGEYRQQPEDGGVGGLGNAKGCGREQERADAGGRGTGGDAEGRQQRSWSDRGSGRLGDALGPRLEGHAGHEGGGDEPRRVDAEPAGSTAEAGAWDGAEFIPCSDGKARPVKSSFLWMADGIPAILDGVRSTEEVADAAPPKTGPDQALQELRSEDGSSATRRGADGGPELLHQEGLLRPSLHGDGLRRDDQDAEPEKQSPSIDQGPSGRLRDVWGHDEASRSSQERRPDGQPPIEPSDLVRFLSSSLACPTWETDLALCGALPHLRRAAQGVGVLPEALSTLPQVWRSLDDEARQQIGRELISRGARRHILSPLAGPIPARVAKLRAAGNSIVPQVAAAFIRATMP